MSGEFIFPDGVRAIRVRRREEILDAYSGDENHLHEGQKIDIITQAEIREIQNSIHVHRERAITDLEAAMSKTFAGRANELSSAFKMLGQSVSDAIFSSLRFNKITKNVEMVTGGMINERKKGET